MTVQAYTKHNSINNWKKKDNKCHRMKIEKKIMLVTPRDTNYIVDV